MYTNVTVHVTLNKYYHKQKQTFKKNTEKQNLPSIKTCFIFLDGHDSDAYGGDPTVSTDIFCTISSEHHYMIKQLQGQE